MSNLRKAMVQRVSAGNPAVLQAEFNARMAKAQQLEQQLEDGVFVHDDEFCSIRMNGKPVILELTLKHDCTAQHLLAVINTTLAKVHIARDAMARDVIGGR